ncbi:hypothetical protein IMCC20628_00732 [Hoeflea sp. IMCC20628]|uniref:PH domain-containing protein n=1 Tax=Hoeflea sp. IMCC20628 TaxID=1620421 RepID=UPI00063AA593|nr:PH domain-containing protein [Hoeflea sp. IMCC20628]AKH99456.1 hypothetical protein IMCC20628_00732 [Hoeflea sp. IMCC20628]
MEPVDSQFEPKNMDAGQIQQHRVAWRANAIALFLPGLAVAAGYGGLWLVLYLDGRGAGALARVSLMVLVIGVPLLLAHAGLRLSTTRLTLRGTHLEAHPGFPSRDPVIVAYPAVTRLSLRRGLSGWITGAGSLVIERENGAPVIIPGLSHPDAALAELSAHRASFSKPG